MNENKPKIIVVSAPSGCGKGTILGRFFENSDAFFSVSCTTRQPREGEVNGVNYHFLTNEEFEKMIAEYGFLEYAGFADNYYGTPKKPIEEALASGRDAILEIETNGAFQIKELIPDAALIFILPPAVNELRRRLYKRATEDSKTIEKRVSRASGEIELARKYDYVIMNDDLDDAVRDFGIVYDTIKGKNDTGKKFDPYNEEISNLIREVLDNA